MIFRKKVCWYCGRKCKSKYCAKCGAKQDGSKVCPDCGETVDERDKTCPQCGHNFKPTETLSNSEKVASKAYRFRKKSKKIGTAILYIIVLAAVVYMIYNYGL